MGDIFGQDFKEFIQALLSKEVDFVLVGGYAVILRGYSRTTGDLDIFVDRSEVNYLKLTAAFELFGLSKFDMSLTSFRDPSNEVFSFGRPPVSIDIITNIKGLSFKEAQEFSSEITIENLTFPVLTKIGLRKTKSASARPKDFQDLLELAKIEEE